MYSSETAEVNQGQAAPQGVRACLTGYPRLSDNQVGVTTNTWYFHLGPPLIVSSVTTCDHALPSKATLQVTARYKFEWPKNVRLQRFFSLIFRAWRLETGDHPLGDLHHTQTRPLRSNLTTHRTRVVGDRATARSRAQKRHNRFTQRNTTGQPFNRSIITRTSTGGAAEVDITCD